MTLNPIDLSNHAAPERQEANHAIVVGSSIAGCLAARVLADHFAHVTVLERHDVPVDADTPRKGVPQENHVHLLLERGKTLLDGLFPGFLGELERRGAVVADLSRDIRWMHYGVWKERFDSGITAHYCSRALVDDVIRGRLRALGRVDFVPGSTVRGLLTEGGSNGRVRGVRYTRGGRELDLAGALVVDATGRGSQAGDWLAALGYPRVDESTVQADLGYTTRIYERRREFARDWKVMLVLPKPPATRRMGVISPIEGDRWMVTTGGWFGEYPAAKEAEYLDFLRGLPSQEIYAVIKDAKPLSSIRSYRMKGGLRRHYERMARWPEGFVVMGDALCSFNPLYSQGMTVCAMQADALRVAAAPLGGPGALSRHALRLQRAIASAVEPSWAMARAEDLRFPETVGLRTLSLRLQHWYGSRLVVASARDKVVLVALLRAINLVDDGRRLHRPEIVARVVSDAVRGFVARRPLLRRTLHVV